MSADLCIYCNEIAFKTDSESRSICINRAYTGDCNNNDWGKDFNRLIAPKPDNVVNKRYGINRNTQCPCGSGKKYKQCCLLK